MSETITLHHLERSRSLRVLWLLEELELPYELVEYARDPETIRAPPELREVHPLGKSPVVTIGDLVLAESGAILEYFADAHGALRPEAGTPELVRYRFWLHWAEGSLMPPLLVRLILDRLRGAKLPFLIKPIAKQIAAKIDESYTTPELERDFGFIEASLAEHDYFAGDAFTAADIQMSYPVRAGLRRGRVGERPHTEAWLERVEARPAYQRALERGGPDHL